MENQEALRLVAKRISASTEWVFRRDGLAFAFFKRGQGRSVQGTKGKDIGAGDVLVINGEPPVRLFATAGELEFSVFYFKVEHLFPLLATREISTMQDTVAAFRLMRHYPACSRLAVVCHKLIDGVPAEFNLGHRSHLLRVAAEVISEESLNAHRNRVGFVRLEEHLEQVFESLSSEELLTLSVAQLAERFGYSRRHLGRLFRQYFGFSVAALRKEMRLLKAVSLLRDPDAKVINIAERCGFNHLGLFSTCFRRRFSASPSEWRRAALRSSETRSNPLRIDTSCSWLSIGLCPWINRAATGSQAGACAGPPPGTGSDSWPVHRRPVHVDNTASHHSTIKVEAAQDENRIAFRVQALKAPMAQAPAVSWEI